MISNSSSIPVLKIIITAIIMILSPVIVLLGTQSNLYIGILEGNSHSNFISVGAAVVTVHVVLGYFIYLVAGISIRKNKES